MSPDLDVAPALIISASDFDISEKVNAIKNIYSELKIFELTKEKMNWYYDQAFLLIDQVKGSEAGKSDLINFFEGLMKREH